MVRMKEFDEENKRLKEMYAEKSMQNDLLNEALGKSGKVVLAQRNGRVGGQYACAPPVLFWRAGRSASAGRVIDISRSSAVRMNRSAIGRWR